MKYTRVFFGNDDADIKKTVWHYDTDVSPWNPVSVVITYGKTDKQMKEEQKKLKDQKRVARQMRKIEAAQKQVKTKKKTRTRRTSKQL